RIGPGADTGLGGSGGAGGRVVSERKETERLLGWNRGRRLVAKTGRENGGATFGPRRARGGKRFSSPPHPPRASRSGSPGQIATGAGATRARLVPSRFRIFPSCVVRFVSVGGGKIHKARRVSARRIKSCPNLFR